MSIHHEVSQKRDFIPVQGRSEVKLHLKSLFRQKASGKDKLLLFSEIDGLKLRMAYDQLNSIPRHLDSSPTWSRKQR